MLELDPRRRRTAGPMLTGLLFACGCQPPPPPPDIPFECRDDTLSSDPLDEETVDRRGVIKLYQWYFADGSDPITVIGAKFEDFSRFTGTSQDGTPLSGNCIGLTGAVAESERHCEYSDTPCVDDNECPADVSCRDSDRLNVAGVQISGLAGGDIDLFQQDPSFFSYPPPGDPPITDLFGDGTVDIGVQAASGAHAFVQSDGWLREIPPPHPVDLQEPDLSGGAPLGIKDHFIRWTPGSNPDDLVYIDIVGTESKVDPDTSEVFLRSTKISCVAIDDGCQGLWRESVTWLFSPDAASGWNLDPEVQFVISRRSRLTVDLGEDTPDTELSATLSAELRGRMTISTEP